MERRGNNDGVARVRDRNRVRGRIKEKEEWGKSGGR